MGGKQCFPLFGKRWKTLRMENSGENSILGPQISSSQIGRKIVGRKLRKMDLLNFYTNALWNQVKKINK